ncbi:uncharacterized protein LOC107624287 isoform X2 [Arachis ipaensis]|uniref:uncharacterized protein LOC107624287 isoform X2 n=1 Tax=Arachis ipaensis TaxID=130454 RepID=UPI000A2B177E|nr:uncharacterized protein LOC107624287 isoform X2 [Arachis ipaensis]
MLPILSGLIGAINTHKYLVIIQLEIMPFLSALKLMSFSSVLIIFLCLMFSNFAAAGLNPADYKLGRKLFQGSEYPSYPTYGGGGGYVPPNNGYL